MREVDIEDINTKFEHVLSRDFPKPTLEDVAKYKSFVETLLTFQQPINDYELTKLRRQYKFNQKRSFLFHIYLELKKQNVIDTTNENVLRKTLQIKPCKSWSGLVTITIFTAAYPTYKNEQGETVTQSFSCAFNCAYCPQEPNEPRSYLKGEPAVLRANRNNFDCALQMWDRMQALYATGHNPDKCDIIVSGGTWTSYPKSYREEFCRDIYYAANTFWDAEKRDRLSLKEEQDINKNAQSRIVGLTIETRPDTITSQEIQLLRSFGVTRVQIGIQHINDEILNKVNRKCTTQRTIHAIELLKNACFKITAHWMLNLPDATPQMDHDMLNEKLLGLKSPTKVTNIYKKQTWYEYFTRQPKQLVEYWETYDLAAPELSVDSWKIYPTAITPWTEIEKWYKEGSYVPYSEEDMKTILIRTLTKMYPFIRIERLIRDIPEIYMFNQGIGSDKTNMRQELEATMKEQNLFCMDIRNREVKNKEWDGSYVLTIRQFEASNGKEYFISAESDDHKTLYGFVRLRLSIHSVIPNCALIREVHVYGDQTSVGLEGKHVQHKGIGKALMAKAEDIAISKNYQQAAVIAAEGNKQYYEKLGYMEQDLYMIKQLQK